ncbi:MAG TPA: hypothetical protein VLX85_13880 [Stellaceae bacterium]|nr:hypothetical protein [Stellaceae bacterium]
MALTKTEDALSVGRVLDARPSVDVVKLVIWAAAAIVPWTVIFFAARWLATALS